MCTVYINFIHTLFSCCNKPNTTRGAEQRSTVSVHYTYTYIQVTRVNASHLSVSSPALETSYNVHILCTPVLGVDTSHNISSSHWPKRMLMIMLGYIYSSTAIYMYINIHSKHIKSVLRRGPGLHCQFMCAIPLKSWESVHVCTTLRKQTAFSQHKRSLRLGNINRTILRIFYRS